MYGFLLNYIGKKLAKFDEDIFEKWRENVIS